KNQVYLILYFSSKMKTEVSTAASFVARLLRGLMLCSHCPLTEHYQHHWFPQAPCEGSGYRCLRINHKMDPLIGQAVSYRIGEDGSICVLYESTPPVPTNANTSDMVSCKEELRFGRSSPSKWFMMTVSSKFFFMFRDFSVHFCISSAPHFDVIN
uniref:Si:dkey-42i9.4 n=1 Tax=Hucho hucho TaxID=62062 RepID=A0A4W5KIG2_9TELE